MAASAISGDLDQGPELAPTVIASRSRGTTDEPIIVHLEESAEPEDVNDNAGAVMPYGQIDRARATSGTGRSMTGPAAARPDPQLGPRSDALGASRGRW